MGPSRSADSHLLSTPPQPGKNYYQPRGSKFEMSRTERLIQNCHSRSAAERGLEPKALGFRARTQITTLFAEEKQRAENGKRGRKEEEGGGEGKDRSKGKASEEEETTALAPAAPRVSARARAEPGLTSTMSFIRLTLTKHLPQAGH